MNQNNIYESKQIYKNVYFEVEDWVTRKVIPARKDQVTNVYHFYKKFNLEELGFIKAELVTQNSDLILKIKNHIPTHPNEWSMSMIKDATLFHLNLFEKLYSLNLALKSSSLQNIFFDNTKPKFSDLTTLSMRDEETLLPLSINETNLKNTVDEILLILELIKQNKYLEIRQILQESNNFILHKKIGALLAKSSSLKATWEDSVKTHAQQIASKKSFVDQCKYLHDIVTSIDVLPKKTDDLCYKNISNAKQKYITQIITSEQPQTVLDINAGSGFYSFLAEQFGAKVIATDTDEFLIDKLYLEAKNRNLNILPLFMPVSAISKRISRDLVLYTTRITEQNLDFERTIKKLHEVAKKTLIIDFDETNIKSHTLAPAINCGLKYFNTVETFDLQNKSNKLLVFKK